MSGKKSRNKGAQFEREIANRFRTERTARIGKADGQDADILHPKLFIECKRRAKLPVMLMRWWTKTSENAAKVSKTPLLVIRQDRGQELIMMELSDLIEMSEGKET